MPARMLRRLLGRTLMLACLAGMAACASHQQVDNRVEAQHYAAVAKGRYTAPGTREDPWGPYVIEAAARYDVPQSWIRNVMRVESGGKEYAADGSLITSGPGAMGLMQVMPETYDELKDRYSLGADPYDPHNNILAGTAYLREMYDLYGTPGFLAAYNAGPARLDKYLTGSSALPDETRRYVAMIAPSIEGDMPAGRSPADTLALNQLPANIPAGLRYARAYAANSRRRGHGSERGSERAYASAATRTGHGANLRYAALDPALARSSHARTAASLAHPGLAQSALAQAAPVQPEPAQLQLASASPRASRGFHLISSANAAVLPIRRGAGGSGGWAIQVGAFGNQGQARAAADAARSGVGGRTAVGVVHQAHGTLYRARLTGLSRDAAASACERMHKGACIVLSPDAQS